MSAWAMIRRAQPSDISGLAAFYHAVWHETQAPFMPRAEITYRSMEFFGARMAALLSSTLLAEREGEIAAFSAWRGRLLGQLFVSIQYRGTNIAPSLLTASEVEMAKAGVTAAELHCVVGNDRARRFYERMGWRHEGQIVEQVAGERVPFWRMAKMLAISTVRLSLSRAPDPS